MISFAWPWAFFTLPIPLIVFWWFPGAKKEHQTALQVPFLWQLAGLGHEVPSSHASPSPAAIHSRPLRIAVIAWVSLVTALANPQWLGKPQMQSQVGRNLLMAIDLSKSMEMRDMQLGKETFNRLEAIQVIASDFVSRRQGDRVGLILFGDQAYLQVPLTFDRETVRTMLRESFIGLAGDSTAMGDAIGLALKRLKDQKHQAVIILLTDGANTSGELDPKQAASLAAQAGVRIYTIGMGAKRIQVNTLFGKRTINPSTDLDEATLTEIAKTTGGRYFRAEDVESLGTIYQEIDRLEPIASDQQWFRPVQSLFYWPLSVSLLLSMILVWQSIAKQKNFADFS